MKDDVVAVFDKGEETFPLKNKLSKFTFDDLIKHPHFYYVKVYLDRAL